MTLTLETYHPVPWVYKNKNVLSWRQPFPHKFIVSAPFCLSANVQSKSPKKRSLKTIAKISFPICTFSCLILSFRLDNESSSFYRAHVTYQICQLRLLRDSTCKVLLKIMCRCFHSRSFRYWVIMDYTFSVHPIMLLLKPEEKLAGRGREKFFPQIVQCMSICFSQICFSLWQHYKQVLFFLGGFIQSFFLDICSNSSDRR